METIKLSDAIGKNYNEFWHNTKPLEIIKGSRASKKSTTTALRLIYRIMSLPFSNAVVFRRFYSSLKDSCFNQLLWAIDRLGVGNYWHASLSPLKLTYKKTGQQILFKGLDKPDSLTSLVLAHGYLCWFWVEEAYQIESYETFKKIELSLRGKLPNNLFKQITLTFNPWSSQTWIKKYYWDNPDPDIYKLTTNYKQNEFLGIDDLHRFETIRTTNPRRYQIEGLGDWGISQGLIFENWRVEDFDIAQIANLRSIEKKYYEYNPYFGIDFGFNNPTALVAIYASERKKTIYIFDEIYQSKLTEQNILDKIKQKGYNIYTIVADSEDPRLIQYLNQNGCNARAAKKGQGSVINGIRRLQDYKIIVSPKCENTIKELSLYAWQQKNGISLDVPIKENDHLVDALRYATENLSTQHAGVLSL